MKHKKLLGAGFILLALGVILFSATFAASAHAGVTPPSGDNGPKTTTPIKHVVVIFQENVSFDHYFGTYPNATNPSGEPRFTARPARRA